MNFNAPGLTGNFRYRIGKEGLFRDPVLVVQVEVVGMGWGPRAKGFWRDATIEDMRYMKEEGNCDA